MVVIGVVISGLAAVMWFAPERSENLPARKASSNLWCLGAYLGLLAHDLEPSRCGESRLVVLRVVRATSI